jgi:hypothetical protein
MVFGFLVRVLIHFERLITKILIFKRKNRGIGDFAVYLSDDSVVRAGVPIMNDLIFCASEYGSLGHCIPTERPSEIDTVLCPMEVPIPFLRPGYKSPYQYAILT